MDIPHFEARKLIQLGLDESLNPTDRDALREHVSRCTDCRVYENEISDMEKLLRTVMQGAWAKRPAPLSLGNLRANNKSRRVPTQVVAMRLSAFVFVAAVAVIAFGIWQISLTNNFRSFEYSSPEIPPYPTASMQITSTHTDSKLCGDTIYQIQPDDTLARIALQFSVSEEAIKLANDMSSEDVITGIEIVIPQCTSTPTGTVSPSPSLTITVQSQTPGSEQ